jgi:trimethylamine--corrinoid protein Co-methyltransferase
VSDAQSGHEKTLTGLLPALAGANLIYGLGMLEMGVTFSYGQLVMDCDFARMIKFVVNGIPVNDESLAVDVIREVGQFKDFLGHPMTFKFMRSQSQPQLIDRTRRDRWTAAGAKDLYTKANEKAIHILENHQPDPLPESILKEVRGIVDEVEADVVGGRK